MTYTHRNKGVCSSSVSFDIDDNGIVSNVRFIGGCNGNTQGVARLAEGRHADELIAALRGIRCGMRTTSCPDQLAQGIEEALKKS